MSNRAHYDCPKCDRPTLEKRPDMIVAYQCAVCDELVREREVVA